MADTIGANKQRGENSPPRSPGRPKGSHNKTTKILKDALLQAAEEAGGKDGMAGYLRKQATENPGPFMALLGKVLPLQVTGEGGGPIKAQVTTVERRIVRPPDPNG